MKYLPLILIAAAYVAFCFSMWFTNWVELARMERE